jgi:hypothetical protein
VSADIEPGGDLSYDENGARVTLLFTLRNTGHSPAQHVRPSMQSFTRRFVLNVVTEQGEVCRTAESASGLTLFPGDQPRQLIASYISKDEIAKYTEGMRSEFKTIFPTIIVCIGYKTLNEIEYHHTPYIFNLMVDRRKDGDSVTIINLSDGNIPRTDLRLMVTPLGFTPAEAD